MEQKVSSSQQNVFWQIAIFAFIGLMGTFIIFQLTYQYEPSPAATIEVAKDKNTVLAFRVLRKDSSLWKHVHEKPVDAISPEMPRVSNLLFNRDPAFLLWSTFFNVMMAIALGIFPFARLLLRQLQEEFSISRGAWWTAFTIVFVLMTALTITTTTSNGYYYPEEVMSQLNILFKFPRIPNILVGVAMISMIPQVMVIVLVGFIASRFHYDHTQASLSEAVIKYTSLDRSLRTAIVLSAIILIFSVLTTSTLRRSIHGIVEVEGFDLFPAEAVYSYAFVQSFFIAILYAPSYIALRRAGNSLQQDLLAYDAGNDGINLKWKENTLSHIHVPTMTMETFELLFGVLAPFIGSFIPDIL